MNRTSRLVAAATLTTGLGLGLVAPAAAAPAPTQIPCLAGLGGVAYPPGACTYSFTFFGPSSIVVQGNTITFQIGGLPPFTIVLGFLPGSTTPVQATTDADGNATLAVPTDGLPAGQVPLRVETPANGTVTADLTVVSPYDPAGLAAAEAAATPVGAEVAAASTPEAESTAAVDPKAFSQPADDSGLEYAVLGTVLAGGLALSTVVVSRRRKQD